MDSYLNPRRIVLIFFFLPLILLAEKWDEAKRAYSLGEFEKAFSIYIEIAESSENPQEKAQAYIYAAWCKYTTGEKQEMQANLQKALELWPDIYPEMELFNEEFSDYFKSIKNEKIPALLPEEKITISKKIDEINTLFQNRKFRECINQGKQISTNFKYKQIYKILGDCLLFSNQFEEALETYKIALRAPLFQKEEETILTPEAQLKKARSLYRRGEKKQALQILNSLVYSYNPPAEAFGLSGMILMEENLFFEAEKVLSQGLILNSGNANYYNLYGVALYIQGKYTEAIKLFQQAISTDKFFSSAMANLALCYTQFKEYSAAETYFSQAIGLDPTNSFYLKEFGKALLASGKYKDAINRLSEALKYEKDPTTIYYLRGIAYLFEKNYENAFKDLDNYLSKRPEDLRALEFYGVLLKEQNQFSKAIEYLKKSNSSYAKKALAQCYLYEKKPEEALNILKELPEDLLQFNDMAYGYLMLGEYKKAYETIEKIPQTRRAGRILENIELVEKIFRARSSFGLE